MRKVFLAGLGLACVSSAAVAADLGPYGRRSMKDTPPPAAYYQSPFSWTGFYLGAQAGYGWGTTDASSGPFGGPFTQGYSYDTSGFLGGVHAGFNWQASQLVIGVETDLEASGMDGSGLGTLGFSHQTSIDWLGSLRGRVGVLMTPQTLLYLTGGLAYGGVSIDKAAGAGAATFASYSDWRTGWTLGGGLEHAFSPGMTARIEYRYTDLGTVDFSSIGSNSIDRSDVSHSAVRAGLSFRF